jgi:hypothetical protein
MMYKETCQVKSDSNDVQRKSVKLSQTQMMYKETCQVKSDSNDVQRNVSRLTQF